MAVSGNSGAPRQFANLRAHRLRLWVQGVQASANLWPWLGGGDDHGERKRCIVLPAVRTGHDIAGGFRMAKE